MKRCFVLFILLLLLAGAAGRAEDGWRYRLDEAGYAHLTGGPSAAEVSVPHRVDGKPVVGLDSGAIGEATIRVTIPSGVTEIAEDAIGAKATVLGWNGGYPQTWAMEHGRRFSSISKLRLMNGVFDVGGLPLDVVGALISSDRVPEPWNGLLAESDIFYHDGQANEGMGEACVVTGVTETKGGSQFARKEYPLALALQELNVHATNLRPDFSVLYSQPGVRVLEETGTMAETPVIYEGGRLMAPGVVQERSVRAAIDINDNTSIEVEFTFKDSDFDLDVNLLAFQIRHLKVYVNYDVSVAIKRAKSTSGFKNINREVNKDYTSYGDEDDYDLTYHSDESNSFRSYRDTTTNYHSTASISSQDDYKQITLVTFAAGPVIIRGVARFYMSASGAVKLEFSYENAAIGYEERNGAGTNLCREGEFGVEFGGKFEASLGVGVGFTASLAIIPDVAEVMGRIMLDGSGEGTYDFMHPETRGCIDIGLKVHMPVNFGFGLKNAILQYKRIVNKFHHYGEIYNFASSSSGQGWIEYDPDTVRDITKDLSKNLWIELDIADFNIYDETLHYEFGKGIVEKCSKNRGVLTLDPNDGISEIIVRHLDMNSTINPDQFGTFTRPGYDFVAWLDDSGKQFVGDHVVDWDELTLTAKWKAKEVEDDPEPGEIDFSGLDGNPVYVTPSTGSYISLCIRNMSNPLSAYLQWTAIEAQRKGEQNYFSIALSNGAKLHAYEGRASLISSLTLPAPFVTSAGSEFSPNLTTVTFNDGMTDIGTYEGCVSLKSVTIPPLATTLHERMFTTCRSLSSVTLPSGVTRIPYYCFGDCTSLKGITLPSTITEIGSHAFNYAGLMEITLPSNLTTLGDCAFYGTKSLASISIPQKVTSMPYAFANSGIKTVEMPGSGSMNNMEGAFSGCAQLTTATVREGIRILETNVFLDCPSLSSVTLPSTLERICVNAFSGCKSLSEVALPDGVVLDSWAFVSCPGLKTITGGPSWISNGAFTGATGLETVTLDCDRVELDYYAFAGTGIKTLTITGNDIIIRGSAFESCPSLETVTLKGGNVQICYGAFGKLSSLKSVTIEGNLIIENSAFDGSGVQTIVITPTNADFKLNGLDGCPELKTLHVNGSVGDIADAAFQNDFALEDVKVEGMSGSILENAFQNCLSMENFSVPDGAQTIQRNAFDGCDGLKELTIPDSVSYIDETNYIPGVRIVASVGSYAFNQSAMSGMEMADGGKKYTLTLTDQFGQTFEPLSIYAGTQVDLPVPEAFDGFWFDTWCTDAALTRPVDGAYTMPAKNVTLYGRWNNYNCQWDILEADWRWVEDGNGGHNEPKLLSYGGDYASFFLPDEFIGLGADCLTGSQTVIRLGPNVREIDDGAFRSASNLRAIIVAPGNPWFFSINGILYSADGELVAVPRNTPQQELYIPSWVNGIRNLAMAYNSGESAVQSLTLPLTITQCGLHAFDGLSGDCIAYGPSEGNVAKAMVNSSAVYNRYMMMYADGTSLLGMNYAFAGSALNAPDYLLPDQLITGWSATNGGAEVARTYTVPVGGDVLYAVTQRIQWMKLPSALRDIEIEAFDGSGIGYIYCPDGVEQLGDRAFANCARLKRIRIPETVGNIADNAFAGTTDVVIQGKKGSAAERYAFDHGMVFVEE